MNQHARIIFTGIFSVFILLACSTSKRATKKYDISMGSADFMINLLSGYPQYFDSIVKNKDELGVQIIYTRIDRNRKGAATFTDHYFNVNSEKYFYPASTVKLPVAILALQKLRELNIPGLDMNTTMVTFNDYSGQSEVFNDPSTPDGRPTIAHYIKKILLVSDNDAFNRLYEFLGQEYINNTLHKMGYTEAQIIHRLSISLSEDENRHSNSIRFIDTTGKIIYEKPAGYSKLVYAERNDSLGKGFYSGGEVSNEPFDFSTKNRIALQSLHSLL
jgi:cell division protein FtsI/penicillin-binding protein 2